VTGKDLWRSPAQLLRASVGANHALADRLRMARGDIDAAVVGPAAELLATLAALLVRGQRPEPSATISTPEAVTGRKLSWSGSGRLVS
jgi:hypothetical protein